MFQLVLASRSPRRRELLSLLGAPFEVIDPDVHEEAVSGGSAREIAVRLACMKAEAVTKIQRQKTIVAADTVVILGSQVMGKPADAAAAFSMLETLRGRKHRVISGVAIVSPAGQAMTVEAVETQVWMRDYQDEEIADYIARGEPFDKAGGYAIQDQIFLPVGRIEGCYTNVMGLPLCHLYLGLGKMGFPLPSAPARACEIHTGQPCLVAAQILR